MVGLPQLNNTLRLVVNETLRQRFTMNYNQEGLSKTEAKDYILHKLKGCELHTGVFEDTAVEAILNASNGIPRIINKLCMPAS